jgi:hypothetical protein
MIMLPLHGQNTAALQKISGQAIPQKNTREVVFDKQADIKIAEFLLKK